MHQLRLLTPSQETSPSNESKAPKLPNMKSKAHDSYKNWKETKIGNGHLPNEKMLQFLQTGCENVNQITTITEVYSSNPAQLRRQLESLIGKIVDGDVKRFIKEVCETIPLSVPPNLNSL